MPAATNKPQPYAQSPQPEIKGSLQPYASSIGKNFELLEASIRQIIAYLYTVQTEAATSLAAAVKEIEAGLEGIETEISSLDSLALDAVYLTAAGGGSTWNMTSYPDVRAIIIDPNGESNTLNLPALGADDRACVTVKCLSNSGNVTISGGAKNIVGLSGGGTTVAIPYAFVADGTTISTYAITLIWVGAEDEWHIIDTAILTA